MKDKHRSNEQDRALFRLIQKEIKTKLRLHTQATAGFLVMKFVFYVTLMSWSYYCIFQIQSPWLFIFNYVLYGLLGILLAFNFAHDLSHHTVFKSPYWNNQLYRVIYTLLGAHAESWQYRHVYSHHFAPNVRTYDTDLSITNFIRVEPQGRWLWFHRYQHIYAPFAYMTYSLFWVFIKDFVIYFYETEPKKTLQYHLSFWIQKMIYLGYLMFLPLYFSAQPWGIVLAAFLAMHLIQSLFLLFTFFITHHVEGLKYPEVDAQGLIQTSWLRNQVESSNDFYPFSFWANFIFGGFNNHIAHHLFPHINAVYYPQLNRILYQILKQEGITPHHSSYLGGVRSHLRHLKKMGDKQVGDTPEHVGLKQTKAL